MTALLLASALAQTASQAFTPAPLAGREVFELRVGVAADQAHAQLCGEAHALSWLSIEACGTGAGVLHQDPGAELAHFRTRASRQLHAAGRLQVDGAVGAGFAELQVGEDAPGFLFGEARTADQTSGAGPEASASVKARFWMTEKSFLVGDLTGGAAHVPAAPTVSGDGPLLPFGAVTVGLGF